MYDFTENGVSLHQVTKLAVFIINLKLRTLMRICISKKMKF